MKFTYQPGDAEPKVWTIKPRQMDNRDSEAIEKVSGMRFPQWEEEFKAGRVSAVHALLWVLLKKEHPQLAYDAVQFINDDWDLDFDEDEKVTILEVMGEAIAEGKALNSDEQELYDAYMAEVGHLLPQPEETVVEEPVGDAWELEAAAAEATGDPKVSPVRLAN